MTEEETPGRTHNGKRFTFEDGVWKIYMCDDSDETHPIIKVPVITITHKYIEPSTDV